MSDSNPIVTDSGLQYSSDSSDSSDSQGSTWSKALGGGRKGLIEHIIPCMYNLYGPSWGTVTTFGYVFTDLRIYPPPSPSCGPTRSRGSGNQITAGTTACPSAAPRFSPPQWLHRDRSHPLVQRQTVGRVEDASRAIAVHASSSATTLRFHGPDWVRRKLSWVRQRSPRRGDGELVRHENEWGRNSFFW